ncbi:winged helix-turn-helix domain-containing protein, partial [Dyadobacter sp. CY312]|uniref:winged helix-turn-helix domain-containing protein n=1 Tax=Dyadobacter sp. CY312 TaxID=2907303 RepID=UPI001F3B0D6A
MKKQRNNRPTTPLRTLYGLIFLLMFFTHNVSGNNESVQFAEKVNLALRRTAHHLLIENGDSLSKIPAIQQQDINTFNVRVDHLFDYDKLPQLLQESFEQHGIVRPYTVSILNCESGEIQLGYSFQDLNSKEGVPCAGRKQEPGCYNIKVNFSSEPQKASTANNWWVLPIGSLLAGLGFIVWKRGQKVHNPVETVDVIVDNSKKVTFGNSELDVPNLILFSASNTYNLTYREAKLLNLFVSGKNQILERDFILKSVWEDEGIIVGRSVDVFVSRLRKMLANDPQIKISA